MINPFKPDVKMGAERAGLCLLFQKHCFRLNTANKKKHPYTYFILLSTNDTKKRRKIKPSSGALQYKNYKSQCYSAK